MCIKSLTYRLGAPIFVIGLLVLSLLCGCRHGFDPALTIADSKMEEHPDSALMLLNEYRLTPKSTPADSAYYALLLTHARYKNFIDETNDSLISESADYFLKHKDNERASRALFLQGMIQMNANRLGEAAVSFRRGLDIAREGNHHMWEGQCARGLFTIYGKIKNYSEQIKYAKAEYDAFVKGKYYDWANHARLGVLRSFLNNEKYDQVLYDACSLLSIAEESKDSILMEETLVVMGTCKFALGDYIGALDSYFAAYSLNPTAIKATHGYNVAVIVDNIQTDSLTDGMRTFIRTVGLREETLPAFKILAAQGRFEEAFNGLLRYKNLQDSVLRIISRNDVSESLNRYDHMMTIMHQKEVKTERILWASGLLVLAILIGISFWIYRKNLLQKELERKDVEASMEILRTDLETQLANVDKMTADIQWINKKNERMSSVIRDLLFGRYKKINDLCDSYYQDRLVKSKKKDIEKELEDIISDFYDLNFLNEVGLYIDMCLEGLYTSFLNDFPNINDDNKRLFMFLALGLSNRSICVILNIETSNLYNRKSRLKKLIAGSDVNRKEEYIKNIQR